MRVKEQSILELGRLLAKTGQAAGKALQLVRSRITPRNKFGSRSLVYCEFSLASKIITISPTFLLHIELGGLLKYVRPFLISISKAKAARLVRSLLDLFLDMEAATGQEVELCLECIEWAKTEKRTFLRQALEVSTWHSRLEATLVVLDI